MKKTLTIFSVLTLLGGVVFINSHSILLANMGLGFSVAAMICLLSTIAIAIDPGDYFD